MQDINRSLRRCLSVALMSRRRRLGLRLPISLPEGCSHHQREYQGCVSVDLKSFSVSRVLSVHWQLQSTYLDRLGTHSDFSPRHCFVRSCSRIRPVKFLTSVDVYRIVGAVSLLKQSPLLNRQQNTKSRNLRKAWRLQSDACRLLHPRRSCLPSLT